MPQSGLDHAVIRLGDDYLRETVGAIRAAPVWTDDTAIVIVWDEDDYAGAGGRQGQPDRPQRGHARRRHARR